MKIYTNVVLTFIFSFLILNSHVISSRCKVALSRGRASNALRSHSRNYSKNYSKMHFHSRGIFNPQSGKDVICTDASEKLDKDKFDFVAFFIAVVNRATSSFTSDVAEVLSKTFKPAKILNEKCKAMLEADYKKEIANIKEEVYQRAKSKVTDHSILVSNLGLRTSEKEMLERNLNNPKELCNASVKILEIKLLDAAEQKRSAEKLTKLIDYSLEKQHTLGDLFERTHDSSKSEEKKNLYQLIRNKIDLKKINTNNHDSLRPYLESAKEELKDSYAQSMVNESEVKALQVFKCDNLPPFLNDEEKNTCIKINYTTKAFAAIKLFTLRNIATCLAGLGVNQVVGILAGFAADKILSILLNVVGLFAYSIVKIVYYAFKILYYLYEAHSEKKDIGKKSESLGNAVGTGIKIVLSILQVTKRRRFK